MSKLAAKRYGDKLETTLKGDKENPVVFEMEMDDRKTPARGD
jgi:hypothetical protein